MKRTPLARKTTLATKKRATGQISGNKRKSKPKSKTQAQLKRDLDNVFSKYIRQKYADKHTGLVKCFTCSTVKHWKEMQNGHWIARNYLATRFHENNCRVQCSGCNMFQKGRPDVFAVNLLKEGIDIVLLEESKHKETKVDRAWYVDKINYYQSLLVE